MSVSVSRPQDSLDPVADEHARLDTVAIVLAGGEGSRLRPLTDDQCKPAVPFVGNTRIVDFAIANLANSGIRRIFVLAQYKPDSLVDHLRRNWAPLFAASGRVLRVVMPRSDDPADRFGGTADAVAKTRDHWLALEPARVAVFAADHVYRMDVGQMIDAHRRAGAGITVAALPVPLAEAREFGVLQTGADGLIVGFQEKPDHPTPMPGNPDRAYASMGNYVFDTRVLRHALQLAAREGHVDFGRHVLPAAVGRERVLAYDFATNRIQGVASPAPYWRDVGTLASLELARAEVSSPDAPIRIEDPVWPIRPLAPTGVRPVHVPRLWRGQTVDVVAGQPGG
jgi:glucose-1-phosphate adenylyltransferase